MGNTVRISPLTREIDAIRRAAQPRLLEIHTCMATCQAEPGQIPHFRVLLQAQGTCSFQIFVGKFYTADWNPYVDAQVLGPPFLLERCANLLMQRLGEEYRREQHD